MKIFLRLHGKEVEQISIKNIDAGSNHSKSIYRDSSTGLYAELF